MRVRRWLHRLAVAGAVAGVGLFPATPPAAASWQAAGLTAAAVQRVAVARATPGLLYAVAQGPLSRTNLVKSSDWGRTWLPLEQGLPAGFQASLVAVSTDEGQLVLAAGSDGIYRSSSGGVNWSRVPARLPTLTAVLFNPTNSLEFLAGTELSGNYRTSDGGYTWVPANNGLPRDRYGYTPGATRFVRAPQDTNLLFMTTNGFDRLYRSRDGGVRWELANNGLPKEALQAVTYSSGPAPQLFALTSKGLWRSADNGDTWQAVDGVPGGELVAMLADPAHDNGLFVATASGTLLRSTTNGDSWVELPTLPRSVRALTTWDTAQYHVLGAAAGEGLWQTRLYPTLPVSAEPAGRNRVYVKETHHNISPTFYPTYRDLGGADRFGLPRTDAFEENGLLVQYFENGRLEYRPDKKGTAYEVQVSLLGDTLLGPDQQPKVEPFESDSDQRYFEETGHSVSHAFLRYYENRGGLDSLGYPITEELQEDGHPVQYFQRARLEYHAEKAGTRNEVQVGAIGDEILRTRGWLD